jgi:hypothetical protein
MLGSTEQSTIMETPSPEFWLNRVSKSTPITKRQGKKQYTVKISGTGLSLERTVSKEVGGAGRGFATDRQSGQCSQQST